MSRKTKALVLFSSGLLICASWINPFRDRVREGNEKYEAEQYEEALKIYADAAATFDPESRELHFNMGNVRYKQKDYQRAIEEYYETLDTESPMLEAKAHYNIGNASFEQGDYLGAIDEYVKCLKLNRGRRREI